MSSEKERINKLAQEIMEEEGLELEFQKYINSDFNPEDTKRKIEILEYALEKAKRTIKGEDINLVRE